MTKQHLETMIEEDLTKNELYNLAQERRFYINDLKAKIEKMKNCMNCFYQDIDENGNITCSNFVFYDCKSNNIFTRNDEKKDYWRAEE